MSHIYTPIKPNETTTINTGKVNNTVFTRCHVSRVLFFFALYLIFIKSHLVIGYVNTFSHRQQPLFNGIVSDTCTVEPLLCCECQSRSVILSRIECLTYAPLPAWRKNGQFRDADAGTLRI